MGGPYRESNTDVENEDGERPAGDEECKENESVMEGEGGKIEAIERAADQSSNHMEVEGGEAGGVSNEGKDKVDANETEKKGMEE